MLQRGERTRGSPPPPHPPTSPPPPTPTLRDAPQVGALQAQLEEAGTANLAMRRSLAASDQSHTTQASRGG